MTLKTQAKNCHPNRKDKTFLYESYLCPENNEEEIEAYVFRILVKKHLAGENYSLDVHDRAFLRDAVKMMGISLQSW